LPAVIYHHTMTDVNNMRNVLMLTAMLGTLLGAGSVMMRDGRRAEGQVKLEDGAVWVQSPGAAPVRARIEDARAIVIQPSPRAAAAVADGNSPLPDGWNAQDIGDVHRPGAASCNARGTGSSPRPIPKSSRTWSSAK
jgi:hypothetical protein